MWDEREERRVLTDVLPYLACPVCAAALSLAGSSVRCPAGHSFDIARQGYVNLLAGAERPGTADTPAMVAARADFLAAGHYTPLTGTLSRTVTTAIPPSTVALDAGLAAPAAAIRDASLAPPPVVVLDAGAGTGHYLATVLDSLPAPARSAPAVGIALDVSKHALRRAARAHPRIGAAVADLWRPLPVRSGTVDVVLNVFAPRNAAEFHRVLRPRGALVVVTPTPEHLAELVGPLGLLAVDADKGDRLAASLGPHFELASREEVTVRMRLSRVDVSAAARMGPSAHHLDQVQLVERLAALPDTTPVTAAFTVSVYSPVTRG
jgi:23S rRNA (guanine745-N1)-methyltransferase